MRLYAKVLVMFVLSFALGLLPLNKVLAETQLEATVQLGYVSIYGNGAHEITVDSTRGYIYALDPSSRSDSHYLWMVDESTKQVVNSIRLGNYQDNGYPLGSLAVNPDTHKLYVADWAEDKVIVLDSISLNILSTVQLASSSRPYGVAISRDQDRIFVGEANGFNVDVIDGSTDHLISVIQTAADGQPAFQPYGLGIDDGLHKLYVTNGSNNGFNNFDLMIVNTETNSIINTVTMDNITSGGGQLSKIAVNPNNHKVYISANTNYGPGNGIGVVDGQSDRQIDSINIGQPTHDIGVDPNTNNVYVYTYATLPLQLVKIDSNSDTITELKSLDENDGTPSALSIDTITNTVILGRGADPSGYANLDLFAENAIPNAPINLTALSPTQSPVLNWQPVVDASSYNIYRDGTAISNTASTNYTDATVSDGNHSYYITSVNPDGESNSSNSISVLVDKTNPTITYTISPSPNIDSWNLGNTTVTFNCSDTGSGVASCSSPVTLTTEESNQTVTGTATDNVGNTASVTGTVNIDKTAPVVNNLNWSANPIQQGQNTTLMANVTDGLSGVKSVSYTLNGGSPQSMTYDPISGNWIATFGSNLAVNTYNVVVTATDTAGNNSTGKTDVLAVYTTANGYVTGHAKMSPTATDTMPIALDTSNHPAQLVLGFTNVTAPTSGSFDMDYSIKNNQNEFSLSSTSINWVIVQDASHASILGHADMTKYVNGVKAVTTNVTVRFDITLGSGTTPSYVNIKLFNPGDDPNTATPAYVISDDVDANGSNLIIHP